MTIPRRAIAVPLRAERLPGPCTVPTPGSRTARRDPRWPQLAAALTTLRLRHRYAVRIIDADCGCGTLLIEAARHARTLGFTAIEARGIDGASSLIGRARAAAARHRDPAIGLTFDCADAATALAEEAEQRADILLSPADDRTGAAIAAAIGAAAEVVIAPPPPHARRAA